MPIKISKVIKDLNVGSTTIQDFLRKKGIEIDTSNVNVRIADDVYDILVKEFRPDMDQKIKSEKQTKERQQKKKEEAPKVEEIRTIIPGQKPKILGKIDLDKAGKPQPRVEEKPAPEVTAKPEVKPEPKPEVKPEPQVEAKPAQPAVEQPQAPVQPQKEAEPKPEPKPAPELEPKPEPNPEPEQHEPQAPDQPEKPAEPEVFTLGKPEGPTLNVVGKIDLDALNQQTRPKKKTKEEKRNERIAKAQGSEAGKKKRKRIGKEKIDVDKAAALQQNQPQPGKGKGSQQPGADATKRKDKKKRPFKPEVSEEDVQRQVKETLARLTTKAPKKAAKWRKEKREAVREEEREVAAQAAAERKVLKLTEFVTANDLAAMMDIPVNKVIGTCMSLGVMVSINQRLDAETINIVADEFGFKTEYTSAEVVEAIHDEADAPEDLVERSPVVTVMGHVDHGKTSLLDYIRNTNVIAGEAGGITQHIGAYNVKLKNGRRITFLDTPGHAAFTAMRARGAKVTDIVIVIVAADDNVMPQTVEALSHASAAGVPIIFAINKIDKPGANPEKIKEELAGMNYLVEDWGGKYQSQDISAKKGTGVYELLEKVLLEADLLELKANPNRKATGSIIESSLDKGRGYVATVRRNALRQGKSHVQRAQPAHHRGRTGVACPHLGPERRSHGRRQVQCDGHRPGGPSDCQQARAVAARAGIAHAEASHPGGYRPSPRIRRFPRAEHYRQGRCGRFYRGTERLAHQAVDPRGAGQRHPQGGGCHHRERCDTGRRQRCLYRGLPGASQRRCQATGGTGGCGHPHLFHHL